MRLVLYIIGAIIVFFWVLSGTLEMLCEFGWKFGQFLLLIFVFATLIGLAYFFPVPL